MHFFSDAFLESIVLYLRVEGNDGVEQSFVVEKCQIAPRKQQTIPKLELQAAFYSVRLRQLIAEDHNIQIQTVTHWTDSVTVLPWLHSARKRRQVFVANRAVEILDQFTVDEWRHLKGTMKNAEIGTIGVTMSQLLESEWVNGPASIKHKAGNWPEQLKLMAVDDIVMMTNTTECVTDWSKFSRYKRKINLFVYCLGYSSMQRSVVTVLAFFYSWSLLFDLAAHSRWNFAKLFNKLGDNSREKVKHDLAKFPSLLTLTAT